MKVVECPSCQSKFKIDESAIKKDSVKLRCSVCAHVFVHTLKEDLSLEQEFESLLSGENPQPFTEELELEEIPQALAEEEVKLEETPDVFEETVPVSEVISSAQPESVIREIDSILGAGEDVGAYKGETFAMPGDVDKPRRRYALWAMMAVLIIMGGLVWVYRDSIPFLSKTKDAAQNLVRGPFFEIEDKDITYEFVNNSQEGAMLIVKGIVKKLAKRPLKSLQVEARIYASGKMLLDTKSVYAGIVPLQEELVSKKKEEIDSLLTAEPNSIGALTVADEIPFVVVFFGKAAQEGSSIHVEVKEYHW